MSLPAQEDSSRVSESVTEPKPDHISAEPTPQPEANQGDDQSKAGTKPKPRKPKQKRPNYAKIHAKPMPLETFPLPAFVPHNPLSLFRILRALVGEYFSKETSHPKDKYIGYFSYETRSVHVTDPKHVRALWEMGFFGTGNLSRSEPSWLDRETARRKAQAGGTSEEHTSERRQERRLFKLERARAEREMIEEQLRKEGKLVDAKMTAEGPGADATTKEEVKSANSIEQDGKATVGNVVQADKTIDLLAENDELDADAPIVNQEHLQLSLFEAFFLAYGLGVISILPSPTAGHVASMTPFSTSELLPLFTTHTPFPPISTASIRPDAYFLTTYAAYHHYRSLGWVARAGTKFAADLVLYNRGPVFTHAEFSVLIVPEYPEGWEEIHGPKPEGMKWWDMSCVNRVQSQVRKTMVLCYVTVPLQVDLSGDIADILRSYKVREFVVRRWLANRQRD